MKRKNKIIYLLFSLTIFVFTCCSQPSNSSSNTACPCSGNYTYSNGINTFDVSIQSNGNWYMVCTSGEEAKSYSEWKGNDGILYETKYKGKSSSTFIDSNNYYPATYDPKNDILITRGWSFKRK